MEMSLQDHINEEILSMIRQRYDLLTYKDPEKKIDLDTKIRDELGFDSILLIVLQIDIEDRFHMRFEPTRQDLGEVFTTARALGAYVYQCMEKNAR